MQLHVRLTIVPQHLKPAYAAFPCQPWTAKISPAPSAKRLPSQHKGRGVTTLQVAEQQHVVIEEEKELPEYAGIEVIRTDPSAPADEEEDTVGFMGIEIIRESKATAPQTEVLGFEIVKEQSNVTEPESNVLGIEIVRGDPQPASLAQALALDDVPDSEFAGIEILREDGTPLLEEDGFSSIQILRTLTEEEASSDDEDDEDEGYYGIVIERDKPLPYPQELYEPAPQLRSSLRAAMYETIATLKAREAAADQQHVPVPTRVPWRKGAAGPSWRAQYSAVVLNVAYVEPAAAVQKQAVGSKAAIATPDVASADSADTELGVTFEGIEIVRQGDKPAATAAEDDEDEAVGIVGIVIEREGDKGSAAHVQDDEPEFSIEIVRENTTQQKQDTAVCTAHEDTEDEDGILGIEIIREGQVDNVTAASNFPGLMVEGDEEFLGIEIVREGSTAAGEEEDGEPTALRSFEDDDDEEFGVLWSGFEIVRDAPLPYPAELYEAKKLPGISLRQAYRQMRAEQRQAALAAPPSELEVPRLQCRSPAVTRNWDALYTILVDGKPAELPAEEEQDVGAPWQPASKPGEPSSAAVQPSNGSTADLEEEEEGYFGIEIIREEPQVVTASAPLAAEVGTVSMQRLPDGLIGDDSSDEDTHVVSQTAFPAREQKILKESSWQGISIVREESPSAPDSDDEEGGITIIRDAPSSAAAATTTGSGLQAGVTIIRDSPAAVQTDPQALRLAESYGVSVASATSSSEYQGISIQRSAAPSMPEGLTPLTNSDLGSTFESFQIDRTSEPEPAAAALSQEYGGIEIVRTPVPSPPKPKPVEEEYDGITIVREQSPVSSSHAEVLAEGVTLAPGGYAPPQPAQPHPTTAPKMPTAGPPRPPITRVQLPSQEYDLDFSLDPELDLDKCPMGLHITSQGEATFRVWAPHAASVRIELEALPDFELPLTRNKKDVFQARFPAGLLEHGDAYLLHVTPMSAAAAASSRASSAVPWPTVPASGVNSYLASLQQHTPQEDTSSNENSTVLEEESEVPRRDPYARWVDPNSQWCYVDEVCSYPWVTPWERPPHDAYIYYELHVGSFTPEGTFEAAERHLDHISNMGFTAIQLLPVTEASDKWGYSPLSLQAPSPQYGTPDQLRALIDAAHNRGMAVSIDVVLHHAGPAGTSPMWAFDGWQQTENGGIYFENAVDCAGGRKWAFWKEEVFTLLHDTSAMWLHDYRCDGIRVVAAHELPMDVAQRITHGMREHFPGCLLSASLDSEDPQMLHNLGFDAIWCPSGWYDVMRQHRALGRNPPNGQPMWDTGALKAALGLHEGFSRPTQAVKFLLGSHEQIGCQNSGGFYEDLRELGGQRRYPVEMMAGGRGDPHNLAAQRAWYAGMVGGAGLPLLFQGCEFIQTGWWDNDGHHALNWSLQDDDASRTMVKTIMDTNTLRWEHAALRGGWSNIIHEDPVNGVVAFERCMEGADRMIVIVNAGKGEWTGGEYGVWVGGGQFEEVLCTQDVHYSQDFKIVNNFSRGRLRASNDGRLYVNLPGTCTVIFRQVPDNEPENVLPPAATPTIPHHIRSINPNASMVPKTREDSEQ